jgi:putative peptide zinc metalloprotease protein
VLDPSRWVVDTFIAEADIARIQAGQTARVHLGMHSTAIQNAKVLEIDLARVQVLPHAMLDAHTGGPIVTVNPSPGDGPNAPRAPQEALYRVRVQLDAPPPLRQMAVGRVVIAGLERAYFETVFERMAAVLVRESGF